MPTVLEPGLLGPPPLEGRYTSLDAIKAALQGYACDNGYAIKVDSSTPKRAIYISVWFLIGSIMINR